MIHKVIGLGMLAIKTADAAIGRFATTFRQSGFSIMDEVVKWLIRQSVSGLGVAGICGGECKIKG